MKRFFKLIVTKRPPTANRPWRLKEKLEKDRDNRFLSRGPRFRMDAEMIRDNVLAASGLLVRKIGGASVKPYQPEGVWEAVAMIGSNTRDYRKDSGEGLVSPEHVHVLEAGRRRPRMEVLNAPNRETKAAVRATAPIPPSPYPLLTLNDVQFVEAAQSAGRRGHQELRRTTTLASATSSA